MYDFFYRLNTPQWYVIKIPVRYRLLITAMLCSLIMCVWFYAIWQPLRASIAFYNQSRHVGIDATNSLTQLPDKQALEQDTLKQYTQLWKAYTRSSPFDTVADIMSIIERDGLTFCSYQPQGTTTHDGYTMHSFLIEIKGSFEALHAFFDHVQQSSSAVIFDTVRMHKIDDAHVSATCFFKLIVLPDGDEE